MNLALVFHNHQPVGQLPWSFEEAWSSSYAPFLEVLERHPNVRAALHYTGPLLEWLEKHRPQTLDTVRRLVERGQVEILGGGAYEPILAIWPPQDTQAQLQLLSARVETLFGQSPKGAWLAERVWEPPLAPIIGASGLDYTLVDDSLFEAAGLKRDELHGFYEVGAEGARPALRVLPIDKALRDRIPWHPADDSISYLRGVEGRSGPNSLATFADDGEKFGAWPGTYDYIFRDGWLERFFSAIEANSAWLQTVLPRDYLASHSSLGSVSLPSGSYAEMLQWSGGNWRHFLERYEESGDLWREVLRAGRSLELLGGPTKHAQAHDHLLRAQSNDAFWHGTFGGLYLRHLRQGIYAQTARAQTLLDRAEHGSESFNYLERDGETLVLRNEQQSLSLRPKGGQIFGWTSLPVAHNLLSTLRRHRESYHAKDAVIDWYARGACIDHFFGAWATPDNFARAEYPEQGDFVSEAWQPEIEGQTLRLKRDGGVWCDGVFVPVSVQKLLRLEGDRLHLDYAFCNHSQKAQDVWWGSEWNLALTGWDVPTRHYHAQDHARKLALDALAQFDAVTNPIVADNYLGLWAEWEWPENVGMWHVPIETFSQKEGGATERNYQQSAFVFHQRLHLKPHEPLQLSFNARLTAKPRA